MPGKHHPESATVFPWKLWYEPQQTVGGETHKVAVIRRRVVLSKRTSAIIERLSVKEYQTIADDQLELEKFVRRLNKDFKKRDAALEAILTRTAFIDEQVLQRFEKHLVVTTASEEKVQRQMSLLKNYVLRIFVGDLNLVNPNDWWDYRDDWYEYLLSEKAPASGYTKRYIVQVANKFMMWLHEYRPKEVPLVQFRNLAPGKIAHLERRRKAAGTKRNRGYIPDEDWERIKSALPAEIRPWILLIYNYGLRRSEALGLHYEGTDCVYEDYLELKRQLSSIDRKTGTPNFDVLKTPGRASILDPSPIESRRIPHWLADPNETCDLLDEAEMCLMAPETLTRKWGEVMFRLNLRYDIHSLRHTWITRARAKFPSREVQLAAGHASIETTEKYSHDHRKFEQKRLRPRRKG